MKRIVLIFGLLSGADSSARMLLTLPLIDNGGDSATTKLAAGVAVAQAI